MLPDLRFVIGAVLATALLGITLFGLAAAMHISHQSKVGPLEASRLLAYTPDGRHRIFDVPAVQRFDGPFAKIPADPNPMPLQQPAELEPRPRQQRAEPAGPPVAPVQTAANAWPAIPSKPIDDADTVDERAVVDPPLPPDNETPAPAAESAPPALPPEPAAAVAAPVETTPAAPASVVETPAAPTGEVQQVASIPAVADVADIRSDVPAIVDAPEAAPAKRKRAARKAVAKAKRPPAWLAPAPQQPDLFGNVGSQVSTTSTANRPALGFWPLD